MVVKVRCDEHDEPSTAPPPLHDRADSHGTAWHGTPLQWHDSSHCTDKGKSKGKAAAVAARKRPAAAPAAAAARKRPAAAPAIVRPSDNEVTGR